MPALGLSNPAPQHTNQIPSFSSPARYLLLAVDMATDFSSPARYNLPISSSTATRRRSLYNLTTSQAFFIPPNPFLLIYDIAGRLLLSDALSASIDKNCNITATTDNDYDYYDEVCKESTDRWSDGPRVKVEGFRLIIPAVPRGLNVREEWNFVFDMIRR
ncbi:hypothetical protein KSP39_PZI009516 [Platanthera zijinensis]|uniref:Uncharacterized protein n=1 Tax=Platanthera zijinensis TaxID=2320716 RepID=A0AAP0BLL2_9ASPA